MMQAYIVLGAESSGTRMMTQLLINAGCIGNAGHEQYFDAYIPYATQAIVWRRSIPHDTKYPNIGAMIKQLKKLGYSPYIIVMSRDWQVCARSQVGAGHVKTEEQALINIAKAYPYIFAIIKDIPYIVVNFEALILHQSSTLAGVFNVLGVPTSLIVRDENRKWLA